MLPSEDVTEGTTDLLRAGSCCTCCNCGSHMPDQAPTLIAFDILRFRPAFLNVLGPSTSVPCRQMRHMVQ